MIEVWIDEEIIKDSNFDTCTRDFLIDEAINTISNIKSMYNSSGIINISDSDRNAFSLTEEIIKCIYIKDRDKLEILVYSGNNYITPNYKIWDVNDKKRLDGIKPKNSLINVYIEESFSLSLDTADRDWFIHKVMKQVRKCTGKLKISSRDMRYFNFKHQEFRWNLIDDDNGEIALEIYPIEFDKTNDFPLTGFLSKDCINWPYVQL